MGKMQMIKMELCKITLNYQREFYRKNILVEPEFFASVP
jgi:hypothetical protein